MIFISWLSDYYKILSNTPLLFIPEKTDLHLNAVRIILFNIQCAVRFTNNSETYSFNIGVPPDALGLLRVSF